MFVADDIGARDKRGCELIRHAGCVVGFDIWDDVAEIVGWERKRGSRTSQVSIKQRSCDFSRSGAHKPPYGRYIAGIDEFSTAGLIS